MITPERLLDHADAVRAASERERQRLRRRAARLDAKVRAGHANLAASRDKTAATAGER